MRYFGFLLLLLSGSELISQNIVDNGCFEKGKCPEMRGGGDYVCENWFTVGSADYFSSCSNGEVNPIRNFMGTQIPNSGIAYVGIFTGRNIDVANTEVIYTKLNKALVKGNRYILSFYYSLADKCGYVSNAIGISLSKELAFEVQESPLGKISVEKFPLNYNFLITDKQLLADDKKWSFFADTIVAKGGEEYLYISGANNAGLSLKKKEKIGDIKSEFFDWSYYYIDDVVLIEYNQITDGFSCKEKYGDFSFSNIYFGVTSSYLNEPSKSILEELIEVLLENPAWSIRIQGHTDVTGSEKDNLVLSANRANAVKEYLIAHGIDSGRIEVSALGSAGSLGSNASEEEKAKNRRVEILLIRE